MDILSDYISRVAGIAGEIIGFEKILFGSDYPLLKPERYFNEITSAGISPVQMEQIKGLNAARLLGDIP